MRRQKIKDALEKLEKDTYNAKKELDRVYNQIFVLKEKILSDPVKPSEETLERLRLRVNNESVMTENADYSRERHQSYIEEMARLVRAHEKEHAELKAAYLGMMGIGSYWDNIIDLEPVCPDSEPEED